VFVNESSLPLESVASPYVGRKNLSRMNKFIFFVSIWLNSWFNHGK